jgi:hypothetical protein
MKELIIAFLIALAASCIITSVAQILGQAPAYAPYPWPTTIKGTTETGFGLKRDNFLLPEINYADTSRSTMYMTHIRDGTGERNVEFPWGAAN